MAGPDPMSDGARPGTSRQRRPDPGPRRGQTLKSAIVSGSAFENTERMQADWRRRLGWAGLLLLVWSVVGLINVVRMRYEVRLPWETSFWYGAPDALIWVGLTPLVIWVSRKLPIRRSQLVPRLALHVLIALGLSLAHSLADLAFHIVRVALTGGVAPARLIFDSVVRHTTHLNLMLYFLIAGFAHYAAYSRRLVDRERQAAELRAQLSDARLAALRMQLRPHFLFNALNTISGLMQRDVETAQSMVRHLGELLRMSLSLGQRDEIALGEELQFVRTYLEIEHARFRDRLTVRIDAADALLSCAVPAFILQPLVENAIHHGVARNPAGGTVRIEARNVDGKLELRVEDDGPGLEQEAAVRLPVRTLHSAERSTTAGDPTDDSMGGVGLSNTRSRLRELYDRNGELLVEDRPDGGVTARLRLPLRGAA